MRRERSKVDVVNSSFGGCELDYTAAYNGGKASTTPSTYDSLISQGVAQGITWTTSSGDRASSSQCLASGSSRGVPDAAMHMGGCPTGSVTPCNADDSADFVVVGGAGVGLIGTSASSPEFAGLVALKVQLNGGTRLGELTP